MDHGSFLQAIIEAPDDDAPRLVYADWLSEHGEAERAEFIRVQCQLAGMAESDPRRPALAEREQALLDVYAQRWAEPLRGLADEWAFRRGFVEQVAASNSVYQFLTRIREAFALAPIRALRLDYLDGEEDGAVWTLQAAADCLRGVEDLELGVYHYSGEPRLRRLLLSPHLAGLRRLVLTASFDGEGEWPGIPAATLEALLKAPTLAGLTELNIGGGNWDWEEYRLDDSAARALARSPTLTGLTRLSLHATNLDRPGVRALMGSANLAGLTHLELGGTLTEAAWQELARSPRPPALRWLGLGWTYPRQEVVAAVQSQFALEQVDLQGHLEGWTGRGWT
jgi:uncharacterized protein (TIGR02996 family)